MDFDKLDGICSKWVSRLGLGFHPDTRGDDYWPALSAAEVAEYDADMDTLFTGMGGEGHDPYEIAIRALEHAHPDWQTMIADAVSKRPSKRTRAEKRAVHLVTVLGPKGKA